MIRDRIERVDIAAVKAVFPYGQVSVEIQEGDMRASSGIIIHSMGDTSDDMIVAVACVAVGYSNS